MVNNSPARPGTLHGWKEIAAYFGRTVRSAQRWERTLGLPVRRIGTPEGRQIVYADKAELDDWLRRMDTRRLAEDAASVPDDSPESAPPAISRTRRILLASAALIVLTVLGVSAAMRLAWKVPAPAPARFEFAGTEVRALTQDGRLAWTYDLGEISSPPMAFPEFARAHVTPADLDDDGQLEFIVPVRQGPPGTPRPGRTDAVIALSNDGRLLWSVRPETVLSLAGEQFEGPWHFRTLAVSTNPGPKRVWIAYSHHTWHPGIVFELAPGRSPSLRYVQVGWVTALAHWRTPAGSFLAMGGVNNEYRQPALALLADDGAAAQSPQDSGTRFTCTGCPESRPDAYFVFTDSEISRAAGHPYPFVDYLDGSGRQLLGTLTDARMLFVGSSSLSARVEFIDTYWAEHRIFETDGRIGHPAEICPDRGTQRPARRWREGEGWVTLPTMARDRTAGGLPADSER